jgi:hypothetical protein
MPVNEVLTEVQSAFFRTPSSKFQPSGLSSATLYFFGTICKLALEVGHDCNFDNINISVFSYSYVLGKRTPARYGMFSSIWITADSFSKISFSVMARYPAFLSPCYSATTDGLQLTVVRGTTYLPMHIIFMLTALVYSWICHRTTSLTRIDSECRYDVSCISTIITPSGLLQSIVDILLRLDPSRERIQANEVHKADKAG